MSEKSKWFYTEYKSDTRAVVILVHGLNLLPSKMDELAYFFNSKKCDVLRVSLGKNPAQWSEKFSDDYDAALEHAEILELPLYFLGYSLGALIGIHYLMKHPHHRISKLALIAPATHTHLYTAFPALLGGLVPNITLPSLNFKNYRDRNGTALKEYKKMHQLQKELKSSFQKNQINIPTLLVVSQKDELIATSRVTKFAESNPYWKCLTISNEGTQLPRKYHHLMIDSASLGQQEWTKLLKNLSNHFTV